MDQVSTESATTVFNGVPPLKRLGIGDDNLALKATSKTTMSNLDRQENHYRRQTTGDKPSTMLTLAINGLLDFTAPLKTIKLAPVTKLRYKTC